MAFKLNSSFIKKTVLYTFVVALLCTAVYSVYFFLGRNHFQKLVSSGEAMNFMVFIKDDQNQADIAFLAHLQASHAQVVFFFLHPETRLEEDGPTVAELTRGGDESDIISAVENVINSSVHYTLHLKHKNVIRIIDLIEGIRAWIPSGFRNYKGHAPFKDKTIYHLSGRPFADYASLLEKDNNLGRLERVYRHQSIILQLVYSASEYRQVLASDELVSLAASLADITPGLSPAEILSLRDFFVNEKLTATATLFPVQPKKDKGIQKLVFLPKRAAIIAGQWFRRSRKKGGILEEKKFKTRVLNGAMVDADGLARNVTYRLKMKGVITLQAENNPSGTLDETVVVDYSGFPDYAFTLAKKLKLDHERVFVSVDPARGVDLDAVVLIGEDFPRKRKKKKKQ